MSYQSDAVVLGTDTKPNRRSPYLLDRPARIAFSGGRTSGYLLYHILQAFGGTLPDDVVVTFANTGKEREETLEFVRDCQERWGVRIRWVEYCRDPSKPTVKWRGKKAEIGCHSWREVTYETASRNGEPFEAIVDVKADYRREVKDEGPILPNAVQRFCTGELKQWTMWRFMSWLGYEEWTVAVGMRADEPKRVKKLVAQNVAGEEYVAPMAEAGATVEDVMAFWAAQPFDLKLQHHPTLGTYEGNCDLCFLKAKAKLHQSYMDNPAAFEWWARMERRTGQNFAKNKLRYTDYVEGRVPLKIATTCDDEQDTCLCTD